MFRRFLFSRIWSSAQDYAVLRLLLNPVVISGFITQPSYVLDFHLTECVRRKWFVLAVYQFWKGISAGLALKYFTWFIGAGGSLIHIHTKCTQVYDVCIFPSERVICRIYLGMWFYIHQMNTRICHIYVSLSVKVLDEMHLST